MIPMVTDSLATTARGRHRDGRSALLGAGALVLSTLVAHPVAAAPAPQVVGAPAGYQLRLSDDFNGTSIDTALWHYRTDSRTWTFYKPMVTTTQQANAVSEGADPGCSDPRLPTATTNCLIIHLDRSSASPASSTYIGGGVISNQALRFGYYQVDARTTGASGWHNAFWRIGTQRPTTEIDGFEVDSSNLSRLQNNIYGTLQSGKPITLSSGLYVPSLAQGTDWAHWHTFAFAYNESGVRYYIDGVLVHTAAYAASATIADYAPIWLSAVELAPTAQYPARAYFKNLRYYQRDYYLTTANAASDGLYRETGAWSPSTVHGFGGEAVRYATVAGATATWQLTLPQGAAGTYAVYLYNAAYRNGDARSRAQVMHDGMAGPAVTINGRATTGGWVALGSYTLATGRPELVTLTCLTRFARADAVKFVRL